MKEKIEYKIRDNLVNRLDLIESGLSLIEDEYHVKNPNGAGGFIDIFAKDSKGDLVIIELKCSDKAAREAITELSKYIALIRRIKNVKNSEIRLIVISTAWHELLVPFSEFFNATSYQLEGYQLKTDSYNVPLSIERITPLSEISGRNICRRHFIRYYKTEDDFHKAEASIAEQAHRLGLSDFLITKFKLNFNDKYYGSTLVLYWAQQLKNRDFYLEKLTSLIDKDELEEFLDNISEMDEDDSLDELADRLEGQIEVRCETAEIGHPEKLVQRLSDNLWTLKSITKYGIFKNDDRLTDDLLLMDMKGYTGASFVYFFASSTTENRSKIEEISKGIDSCLFHNDTWRHKVKDIINYASSKADCSVTVYAFSKDDILETLWLSRADNPFSWTPAFYVIIDPKNNNNAEIFLGMITWNKKEINLDQAITDIYETFNNYILHRHFGSQRGKDLEFMTRLGLEYQVDMVTISQSGEEYKRNIAVRGKSISESPTQSIPFLSFLQQKQDIVDKVVKLFNERHSGSGIFTF
jgi:Endonuclease NucS